MSSPHHGFRIPGGSLHLESDDDELNADITQDEDAFYTFWEPALQSISHLTPEGLSDVVCRIPHPSAPRTGEYVRALSLSGIAFRQLDPLSLQRLANDDLLMTQYLLRIQANVFPYTLPIGRADSEVSSPSSDVESPVSDDSELGPESTVTSPSSPVDDSPPAAVDSAESPPVVTECGDECPNSNPESISDQAQHPPLQNTVDVDDREDAAVSGSSREETDNCDDQNSCCTGSHDNGEEDSRHTSHPPSKSEIVDPPDGEAHIESDLSNDVSANGASVQAATNPLSRDIADTADKNAISPPAEAQPPSSMDEAPPTLDTTSSLDSSPDECASSATEKTSGNPSASDSDKLAGSPSQLAAAPMQQGAVVPGDSAPCSTPPTFPSIPPLDQGNGSPFLGCNLLQFSPFSMTTRLDDDTHSCPTELFKGSTNLSDFFLDTTHEETSDQLSEEEIATQTEPVDGFSPIPPSSPAPRTASEATDAGETSLRVSDKNNNIRLEDGAPASHGVQEAETEYVHGPVNQVGSSTEPGTDPQLGKESLNSQTADNAENGAVEGSDSRDEVSSSPTVTVIGSPPRLRACDFELACGKNADTSLDPTVECGTNAGPTVSNCNEVQPQSHERALQSRDREPRFGDATADGGEHLPRRNPLRPSLLRLTIPISPSSLEEELTQVSRATETPASEVTEFSQSSQLDRLLSSQSSFAEDNSKPVIKLRRGARQSRGTDTVDLRLRVLVDAGVHNLRRRVKALERELPEDHVATTDRVLNSLKTPQQGRIGSSRSF
ncbi:hypothetical protein R3P38DRAFT_3127999 [Favolaschia claudopus]|uniref:Uncharacterized protein n=1 Tax=Favolaschia claudopus TaxID=2862362 RepID=A0AAV9Z9V9_9AGAR